MPAGRPTDYTLEIATRLCEEIAKGLSLKRILEDDLVGEFPARGTIFEWIYRHQEFAELYARARVAGCTAHGEDILDIADDGTNDFVERENEKTGRTFLVPDQDHIQRSRLRVDTRKWFLAKLMPKLYGERIAHEHSGTVELATTITDARKRSSG